MLKSDGVQVETDTKLIADEMHPNNQINDNEHEPNLHENIKNTDKNETPVEIAKQCAENVPQVPIEEPKVPLVEFSQPNKKENSASLNLPIDNKPSPSVKKSNALETKPPGEILNPVQKSAGDFEASNLLPRPPASNDDNNKVLEQQQPKTSLSNKL